MISFKDVIFLQVHSKTERQSRTEVSHIPPSAPRHAAFALSAPPPDATFMTAGEPALTRHHPESRVSSVTPVARVLWRGDASWYRLPCGVRCVRGHGVRCVRGHGNGCARRGDVKCAPRAVSGACGVRCIRRAVTGASAVTAAGASPVLGGGCGRGTGGGEPGRDRRSRLHRRAHKARPALPAPRQQPRLASAGEDEITRCSSFFLGTGVGSRNEPCHLKLRRVH